MFTFEKLPIARIVAVSLALFLSMVLLAACSTGAKDNVQEKEAASENAPNGAGTSSEVSTQAEETADSKISISNVTISPTSIIPPAVDIVGEEPGYVVKGTVTNIYDVSYNVLPTFSISISGKDSYGDVQSGIAEITPGGSKSSGYSGNVWSPDGINGLSIGLAPNETKEFVYYIYGGDFSKVLSDENTPVVGAREIMGAEVSSLEEWPSTMVYLPKDGLELEVHLEKRESGVTPGMYFVYMDGTLTNNTNDKWKSVLVKFDLLGNGKHAKQKIERNYTFMKPQDSVNLRSSLAKTKDLDEFGVAENVLSFTADSPYECIIIPTLVAYEPDLG